MYVLYLMFFLSSLRFNINVPALHRYYRLQDSEVQHTVGDCFTKRHNTPVQITEPAAHSKIIHVHVQTTKPTAHSQHRNTHMKIAEPTAHSHFFSTTGSHQTGSHRMSVIYQSALPQYEHTDSNRHPNLIQDNPLQSHLPSTIA